MNAKQLAELTGCSVRTLHHYDKEGLLCPARNEANGYRTYTAADVDRLQQILFFKECGFPLAQIKVLLDSPSFDRMAAYALQRKTLLHQRGRIDAMLETLDKSMRHLKGENTMTEKEKFGGLDMAHNPYEAEARALYGDDAVDKSNEFIQSVGTEGQRKIMQGMDELFTGLAAHIGEDPKGEAAQAAMADMYAFFNSSFGVKYDYEMFAGIGRMYVDDERFTKNIDRYGAGLSAFLAEAMGEFARRNI